MRYITILIILFLSVTLSANSFEKNCLNCHFQTRQLEMFMSKYTLKYGSEVRIKKAVFKYIKNPSAQTSVMPRGFLNRWGVKNKIDIDDKELIKAIDIYFKIYNIQSKIQ
ncbi:MAG: hypothetical protein U9Q33_12690 [Campylobacterota bacterium]|nr:hypothetical protein [Campylobacterota bacterium]